MQSHVKKCHRATQPPNLAKGTKIKWTPATLSQSGAVIDITSNLTRKSTSTPGQIVSRANTTTMFHLYPAIHTFPRDTRWSIIPLSDHPMAITKLRQRTHSWKVLDLHVQSRSRKENSAEYESAPSASPLLPKRAAVALDCEMVGARDGEKEHNVSNRTIFNDLEILGHFGCKSSLADPVPSDSCPIFCCRLSYRRCTYRFFRQSRQTSYRLANEMVWYDTRSYEHRNQKWAGAERI